MAGRSNDCVRATKKSNLKDPSNFSLSYSKNGGTQDLYMLRVEVCLL